MEEFKPVMNGYYHEQAHAVWLYKDGIFITYESTRTVKEKAEYVLSRDLGGVAIWELSGDVKSNALPWESLLNTIYEVFH